MIADYPLPYGRGLLDGLRFRGVIIGFFVTFGRFGRLLC